MTTLRWIINIICAILGYWLGSRLEGFGYIVATSPIQLLGINSLNSLYVAFVGGAISYLFSARLAFWLSRQWRKSQVFFRKLSPEVPVAVSVGTGVGLVLTILINNVLSNVNGFLPIHSILIAVVLTLFFSSLFVANREFFKLIRPPQQQNPTVTLPPLPKGGKVLDTSVLIDGRVLEFCKQGFLEGPLWVPKPVLQELQMFADSSDPIKRAKGRRGLDTLESIKLVQEFEICDAPETEEAADDRILAVAKDYKATLVSNDNALAQMARIYGVKALSIQALASAIRTSIQIGDHITLTINKEGREAGQGVGTLEDGTLVVVDDAFKFKGKEVQVVITQSIQTNVGRMFFAKLLSSMQS